MASLNAHGSITPVGRGYAEAQVCSPHFPIHLFMVTSGATRCPCTTSGHWNQQLSGGRTYPTPQPCCDRCATKHNQPRVFPVGSICWEGDNLKGRRMMFCLGSPASACSCGSCFASLKKGLLQWCYVCRKQWVLAHRCLRPH